MAWDQLGLVAHQIGQAGVVVAGERHLGMLHRHQRTDPLQHLVDVERLVTIEAMRAEHGVHQVAQPVGLLDDDMGELGERGIAQVTLQQLGGAADPAQRILDLMGEPARQHLDRLLAGLQRLLAGDAQQPVAGLQLHQQLVRRQRGDGVVHRQRVAGGQGQARLALGIGMELVAGWPAARRCRPPSSPAPAAAGRSPASGSTPARPPPPDSSSAAAAGRPAAARRW